MREIDLSKQAFRKLKELAKSSPKIAKRIKELEKDENIAIADPLKGASEYRKIRVSKYRIIYRYDDQFVYVTIVEKRETVYQKFDHHLKTSHKEN